jgi:hypothetical protein
VDGIIGEIASGNLRTAGVVAAVKSDPNQISLANQAVFFFPRLEAEEELTRYGVECPKAAVAA